MFKEVEEYLIKNNTMLKARERIPLECTWKYTSKEYGNPIKLMSLPCLEISYKWCSEYINILLQNNIVSLGIDELKIDDKNLSFLKDLSFLKELRLRGLSYGKENYNFEGLKYLRNLEVLYLLSSQSAQSINFSMLKKLKICSIDFALDKGNKTLFECKNLEELYIYGYLDKEFSFSQLTKLKILTIQTKSLTTLEGIENLKRLTDLSIINSKKIKDFEQLCKLQSIKRLNLQSFRADNLIETISRLENLEVLYLSNVGKIESISSLENCKNLKEIFIAYGTTVIEDGDLSVFFKLPKLKKVLIETKKHYSHTNEELHKHTGQE